MALFVERDSIPYSRSQVMARAVWTSGRPKVHVSRETDATVQASAADLAAVTSDLLARPRPVVAASINRRLRPVALNAYDKWPVFTGDSKAGLFFRVEVLAGNEQIVASVGGTSYDTNKVHKGWSAALLIIDPALDASALMAVDIGIGIANG